MTGTGLPTPKEWADAVRSCSRRILSHDGGVVTDTEQAVREARDAVFARLKTLPLRTFNAQALADDFTRYEVSIIAHVKAKCEAAVLLAEETGTPYIQTALIEAIRDA